MVRALVTVTKTLGYWDKDARQILETYLADYVDTHLTVYLLREYVQYMKDKRTDGHEIMFL